MWRHHNTAQNIVYNTTQNILGPRQPQPSIAGEGGQEKTGTRSCSFSISFLKTIDQIAGVAASAQSMFSTIFPCWTGHRGRAEEFFSRDWRDKARNKISPLWVAREPASTKQNFFPKYMGPVWPAWEVPLSALTSLLLSRRKRNIIVNIFLIMHLKKNLTLCSFSSNTLLNIHQKYRTKVHKTASLIEF